MNRNYALTTGALLAALGVGLGAYAAHGLEGKIESLGYEEDLAQRLEWFDVAARYHMFHALAIFAVGVAMTLSVPNRYMHSAVLLFVLGIFLFCGALYAMSLAPPGWRKLGAVVPFGGLSFIIAWLTAAYGGWSLKR
jgi:uncharacterized membrane protein YgdD (TMEM256/DUF423 family)